MKSAYFDCFAGISGDMCLGALVDAGVSLEDLKTSLKDFSITGYSLSSRKVTRKGISATKVDVTLEGHGHEKAVRWEDIATAIESSTLKGDVKQKGLHIFRTLFEAEAKVHNEPFERVHLHELGGVDCMVDIIGTLSGLSLLGVERVYTSAVNVGSGTVKTDHGVLPVPAPATAELLKGFLTYRSGISFELTTPTGAALLKGLDANYLPSPSHSIDTIGYGAGSRDFHGLPNILRLSIGEETEPSSLTTDTAVNNL